MSMSKIVLDAKLKMEQFYQRLRKWIGDLFIYLKDDSDDPNQFIRTCVLDSTLAAFHVAYIAYPNIADLLNGNDFFRHLISLLQQNRFYEARKSCVAKLRLDDVDLFGHVNEYLPLTDELLWKEKPPNDSEISRKLKVFGSVIVLGDPSDPPLILVHREVHGMSMELPHYVNDDEKKRTYACIFFLIGKDMHMTMCFPFVEESWLQYDNDPKIPPFRVLDINILKDYQIYLAGYVNVTQALEYKLGIAETGDVEMEDVSLINRISIPETGVGARPFYDSEMPSCSSSDSN